MKKVLIVGLGNVGAAYEHTRHNIGFQVVDALAEAQRALWTSERLALRTALSHKGRKLVLIKPTTYMNLSGKAVRYWLKAERIPLENLLVVVDDIHLDLGVFRLRGKGSDGGHNGLKSLQEQFQTPRYARFRFGIGHGFPPGRQADYVLGVWTPEEWDQLAAPLGRATRLLLSFALSGLQPTMNAFNGS